MVPRRTINIPLGVEATVRELAWEGESFSAAVARLVEEGARSLRAAKRPSYVSTGEGPEDLGRMAERYLEEIFGSR
jgi:hypothetical protein